MPDDHGVIVAGRDAGTELLAVGRLEILLSRDKDVCAGIKPQEITSPLFDQVVGDHIEALLGKPETSALHAGGDHLEGLARTDAMGQERVVAIKDMGDSVLLVIHQGDLRCHPDEADVGAVILPGTDAVE